MWGVGWGLGGGKEGLPIEAEGETLVARGGGRVAVVDGEGVYGALRRDGA